MKNGREKHLDCLQQQKILNPGGKKKNTHTHNYRSQLNNSTTAAEKSTENKRKHTVEHVITRIWKFDDV